MKATDFRDDRRFLVACLWGTAILLVTIGELLPGGSAPLAWAASLGMSDKFQHFAAYFVLASIPVLGFEEGVSAALSMIAYGILLHLAQTFIPGRSFEFANLAADAEGVLAGIVIPSAVLGLLACWRRRGSQAQTSRFS